jgi:hypothetical protein
MSLEADLDPVPKGTGLPRDGRRANKDFFAFLMVPFQCFSGPQHFFQVLEIPTGIVFVPTAPGLVCQWKSLSTAEAPAAMPAGRVAS